MPRYSVGAAECPYCGKRVAVFAGIRGGLFLAWHKKDRLGDRCPGQFQQIDESLVSRSQVSEQEK